MFCHECGNKIVDDAEFCENCGTKIIQDDITRKTSNLKSEAQRFLTLFNRKFIKTEHITPLKVLAVFILLSICFSAYYFYESYQQTQRAVLQTAEQLRDTEKRLSAVASSTAQKLTDQEKELSQKTSQIAKLEADLKNTSNTSVTSSNVAGGAMSSLSPSVVKIVCYSDAYGEDLQMGSGVLYHSSSEDPSKYFVETNLHVVQTEDGSTSKCAIALYPNYKNTSSYLVYKTVGYKIYKYGVDFAYIVPQIADSENAGAMSDLGKYAKNITSTTYCKSSSIGDHVSILGYPSVGGSSLTATDGIVSGFEYDDGTRFIKTSAKIEHGNSGGIAIKDSGCVLGIPTFVETGRVESIGRILDLNDLFSM